MPENDDRQSASSPSVWRRILRQAVITCLVGAVIAFLLHFLLARDTNVELSIREIFSEMTLHIAIGFIVALILVLVLELETRQVAHQEIRQFVGVVAKDVYEAVLERIVPPQIMEEFNNILRFEVTRKECEYTITFTKPPSEMAAQDVVIIRREVSFDVGNLLNRPVSFPIRSVHETDEEFVASFTHHVELRIDGVREELVPEQNLFIEGNHTRLQHFITLDPGAHKRVYLSGEEPVAISARISPYIQMTPALGMRVVVKNDYSERIKNPRVVMNHPQWENVKEYEPGRYRLDKAFLPGQGFQVLWSI